MSAMEKIAPYLFEDANFAIAHKAAVDQYIEYRLHGHHTSRAFSRVFGENNQDAQTHLRIEALEHSAYFKQRFNARLKESKVDELWDTKKSVHSLLSMARDVFAKDSVRLNAIKELNVLCGITVVDENGKTKQGRTLADFYRSPRMAPRALPTPGAANTTDVAPSATGDVPAL
jgi:deoxyribodipyrimidine photolyase-like uncharacterized protein